MNPGSRSGKSEGELNLPRRVSAWKLTGIFVGSLAVTLAILLIWLNTAGHRRFAAMELRLKEMRADTEARDAGRPTLRGWPVPGNGWDDYALALREVEAIKVDRQALYEYVDRRPKADRTKVERLLAAHGGALDHLRRGASRSCGQFPIRWEDAFSTPIPGLLSCQSLAYLAACKSRFLLEAGRPREAAELLLDTCQFARDVGFNGALASEMISMSMCSIAFGELLDLVLADDSLPGDLLEVDRQLALLDLSFPPTRLSILNESLAIGYGFIQTATLSKLNDEFEWKRSMPGSGIPDLKFWGAVGLIDRLGGLRRLILADAFDTSHVFIKQGADLDDKPWAEVLRTGAEIDAYAERIRNPVTRNILPEIPAWIRPGRERRAQLRLLRVAAHYRATGEVLDLDDPFGTKLHASESGDTLTIWSVGRDGVDDGGVGEWKPSAGKDIVLSVRRM